MKSGKTLSVCVPCSNPISMDFPLRECILSAIPIATQIVLINGDECRFEGEVTKVISDSLEYDKEIAEWDFRDDTSFDEYHLPWRDSFRKNMHVLAVTAGISQCTEDYILWLDADEVLHEQDHGNICKCMALGFDAYSFSTIHFYRDYNTVKEWKDNWYNFRPKLFKNGLGIWNGYQSWLEQEGGVYRIRREYTSDLTTWDYKPVHAFSKKVPIDIYHYGWCRDLETLTKKQNAIERRHHPDWVDKEWNWDMSDTKPYENSHPKVMEDRIGGHQARNSDFYKTTIYKNDHNCSCPKCKVVLDTVKDHFGGGSHYWELRCSKCRNEFYFDTHRFKLENR